MTEFTRRSFLAACGKSGLFIGLAAAAPFALARAASPRQRLLMATPAGSSGARRLADLDLATLRVSYLDIEQRAAHGYARNPARAAEVAVVDKIGPDLSIYSLAERKIVNKVASRSGTEFYGHALYTADGKQLLTVEFTYEGAAGSVSVRDADTLKELSRFPSYGVNPHDIVEGGDGKSVLVNNAGDGTTGLSNVVRIDLASGKKLGEWKAVEKNCILGHFTRAGGHVFVSTQKFRLRDEELFHKLWKEKKIEEANRLKTPVPSATYCLSAGQLGPVASGDQQLDWQVSGFSVSASGDGKFVGVTFGPSHSIGIIDAGGKLMKHRVEFPTEVNSIAPAPDGGFLVGTSDRMLWSVELATRKPRKLLAVSWSDHSFLIRDSAKA